MSDDSALPKPPSFVVSIFAMLVRHALTVGAGALATYGVIQTNQTTEAESLGMSVAIWGLTVAWSFVQKKNAATALTAAAKTGIAP